MKSVGTKRYGQIAGQWLASLGPTIVVVVSAATVFKDAVVSSIASTPLPELVYAILGAFFVGVFLTSSTLWRYNREANLIGQWLHTPASDRTSLMDRLTDSYILPLYEILLGRRAIEGGVRQAVMEQEMGNVKAHLEDRLALPHYLAGALVGLGLVGTFIGLLGTLDDLGKLFGALAKTDSSANANPAELFADMVRRLQDPMRGMGTAFVASLYGLLGSLVLGLQILVVSRVGHNLGSEMHTLLRDEPATPDAVSVSYNETVQAVVDGSPVTSRPMDADTSAWLQTLLGTQVEQNAQWQQALDQVIQHQQRSVDGQGQVQSQQLEAMQQLIAQIRRQHDHHVEVIRAAQNEQAHLWQQASLQIHQQFEASLQETQQLKSEVRSVVESVNALALAVRHNLQAEERFRASVPRTSYWQDAWTKVQAYLQRSKSDQALDDLLSVGRDQAQAMARLSQAVEQLNQRTHNPGQ